MAHAANRIESTQRDDSLGRILGYLVALTAILGIPTGLYGYYSGEHTKRVQNTFEFFKEFRSKRVQESYQSLINRYNAKTDSIKDVRVRFRGDIQTRDKLVLDIVQSLISDPDGPAHISEVLLFFDELNTCVESSLCDRNAAVALFNLPAREFASEYGPYVVYIRTKYDNAEYGAGLFKTRALQTEWSFF